MKKVPIISVVIAVKNEEKNIERCLKSLKSQTLSKDTFEVIVVDGGSVDSTQILAKKYTPHVFSIKKVIDASKTKNLRGAQVNYGVKKANGSIIFFPDADMTFSPELLNEIKKLVLDEKIEALYIPEIVQGKGFFGKIRNFERSFYNMTPIDALRVVIKKFYVSVEGFDEKKIMFGPDDWDLTKRIKQRSDKIGITTNVLYHHEDNLDLQTYLIKKQHYTNTFSGYIKKWGKDDPDIRKQLGPFYRYCGVYIENGKWIKLLFHPVLSTCMFMLRLAVGISYLYKVLFRHG